MTSIFLIEGYSGDFAGIRCTASLSGGGMVSVIKATQSVQEVDSGGAIATANGLGLDSDFPSTHSGTNKHGWLGRDDQNKGFADPDRFGWLHYDLGADQNLHGLRLWNSSRLKLTEADVTEASYARCFTDPLVTPFCRLGATDAS